MTSAWAIGALASSVRPMIAECRVFIDGLLGCRRSQIALLFSRLLRFELNRRSLFRKISLKDDLREPLLNRAASQEHENAALFDHCRDVPMWYFGLGTEVFRHP